MSTQQANLLSRIVDLQADFQRVADRASWVGACIAVRPGEVCSFGLGRSGVTRYALNRVWAHDSAPPALLARPGVETDDPALWSEVEESPIYSELLTLSERAGTLLEDMRQAGRYQLNLIPPDLVPYRLDPLPMQHPLLLAAQFLQAWLVFLLHSPATIGYCRAVEPRGELAAGSRIREGETTLAWIDQYAGVCLAGLALLKAELEASSPSADAPQHVAPPAGKTPPAAPAGLRPLQSVPLADGQGLDQYVTLAKMAAIVSRSPRTLEKLKTRRHNPLPAPDIEGGGGKPHEWTWATVRPWLEAEFARKLPERFPGELFRDPRADRS
jgi:hypothetical protein